MTERRSAFTNAIGWIRTNRWKTAILLGATTIMASLLLPDLSIEQPPPSTLLEHRETRYSDVSVYQRGSEVAMTFGANAKYFVESVSDRADPDGLPVTYTRWMTAAATYVDKPRRILEIGLSGGSTGWYMHRTYPDAEVTAVELDPDVMQLASKWFGIRDEPGYRTVTSDGRLFLRDDAGGWDLILVDAYRGTFVPYHMLTREFYALAASRLAPGGALAQNVEPSTMLFDSAARTMATAFARTDLYRTGGKKDDNVVAIGWTRPDAASAPAQDWLDGNARRIDAERHPRYPLAAMVRERRDAAGSSAIASKAPILEDDFAPVDSPRAIEAHDRDWGGPKAARP